MGNDAEEDRIREVLTGFQTGKFDKYEAMDQLDIDHVDELFDLLAQYGLWPDFTPDPYQSDPSAKPAKDYFTEDG